MRAWAADSFSLDVRSLALFRIVLALVVLGDLGIRATELTTFYTDAGIVPRTWLGDQGAGSVHALGGDATFVGALFLLHAAFALAMLVGFRTRLATFATCFLLVSLHIRNPHVLQGGDALLRVLLFWGIFLPLGAWWSVDSRRERTPVPKRVFSVPSAALILQLCFLYWFSAALKSDPAWGWDGTAVYYALSFDQLAKPAGQILIQYPLLTRILTWATWWLEALGPVLLFVPVARARVRTLLVFTFLAFHLVGLNLCMELGPFPYVCAAGWLALLPGPFWDRLGAWFKRPPKLADGRLPTPWGVNLIAAVFLVYVLLWNLRTVQFERFEVILPRSLNVVGFTFGLDQIWAMFSPHPPRDDGWYVCVATLEDGEEVDPLRGGAPVVWDKPAQVSRLYRNERWRKYMINLCRGGQDENRTHLIDYLWDRWNQNHPEGLRMQELRLYYVLEETPPPDTPPPPLQTLLLGYRQAAGPNPADNAP